MSAVLFLMKVVGVFVVAFFVGFMSFVCARFIGATLAEGVAVGGVFASVSAYLLAVVANEY
jgi:hypothetical protein